MANGLPAAAIFSASIVLLALKPVLLHFAQDAGTERLDSRLFFLCAELLKLVICLSALAWRRMTIGASAAKLWKGSKHTVAFLLPAGVYLVMNCTTIYANSVMTPSAFQLTANCKIMTTAVAGWLILCRPLPASRWAALVLLTFGTVLGQASGGFGQSGLMGEANVWGFLIVLGLCCLSAVGGVLTEKLLKSKGSEELSIFATNVHMSAHTLLLNVAAYAVILFSTGGAQGQAEIKWPPRRLMWAVVIAGINEAFNGILLSSIMRHADNNVKNYAFSVSVFVVVGFSAFLFGYWPNPGFFVGAALIIASMILYARSPQLPSKKAA